MSRLGRDRQVEFTSSVRECQAESARGDLLPIFRAEAYMTSAFLSGPLFLLHPESESPAVLSGLSSQGEEI